MPYAATLAKVMIGGYVIEMQASKRTCAYAVAVRTGGGGLVVLILALTVKI